MKILLTGISGVGKTTTLAELQKRGYVVIDLDSTGICRWKNKETQEIVEYGPNGRDAQWLDKHGWYCDIEILQKLLSCFRDNKKIFFSLLSENICDVSLNFDKIFELYLDEEIIRERLNFRTNNHFAKKKEEQDFIFKSQKILLGQVQGKIKINTDVTPEEVVEKILEEVFPE